MSASFGQHLKELRKKRSLLQREVAAKLNMDAPLYSRIERGERIARRDTVIQLAELLKVKKEELLTVWLADQLYTIAGEEDVALPALLLAEEEVRYRLSRRNKRSGS